MQFRSGVYQSDLVRFKNFLIKIMAKFAFILIFEG